MAQKSKKPTLHKITFPAAPFRYPRLSEIDYGSDEFPDPEGSFNVTLVYREDSEDAQALLAKLTPHYEAAREAAEAAFAALPIGTRKKLGAISCNPLYSVLYDKETEEPTGEIAFKVSTKATGVHESGPKKGETWVRKVPLFDAKKSPIVKTPDIWGGTVGKVSAELSPYFISGSGKWGLSLYLTGVQILNLVTKGQRSADDLGFDEEDGYEFTPGEHDDDAGDRPAPRSRTDNTKSDTDDDMGDF
jgi:hypothetical protein